MVDAHKTCAGVVYIGGLIDFNGTDLPTKTQ
jgi:hypothetical protein